MSGSEISMADYLASLAEVKQAAEAAQYVRRPVSVLVHWSESGEWEEESTVPYAEFEQQAFAVALGYVGGGYQKTKVTVNFDDGETYQCRIDLAAHDELGFADHCLGMLAFAETEQGRAVYERDGWQALLTFIKGIDFGADAVALNAEQRAAGTAADQAERVRQAEQDAAAEVAAKQAYQAEIERLKTAPEYAHLAQIGGARDTEVAKNVRADLKHAWQKIKFSVRCERGGYSSSISVSWTDGPTVKEVDQVVNRYRGGYFDGMTDSYQRESSPFCDVFGSVSYMSTERSRSPALDALAAAVILLETGETVTGDENQRIDGEYAMTQMHRASYRISMREDGALLDGEPFPSPVTEAEPVAIEEPATLAEPVIAAAPVLGSDGLPKWFGSQEKAAAWLEKKGLSASHEARQVNGRWEIHPQD